MQIDLDKIKPSPFQPRLEFDLEDLKGSIIKDGILVPLTVRRANENQFELIDGERRLRLAKELGYQTVSCEVIEVDDETADRMVWKVNTLRKDYKPKEKALHYKNHQEQGWRLREIARNHGDHLPNVTAYLNSLKLSSEYQEKIWDGPLSVGHVQVIQTDFPNGDSILSLEKRKRIESKLEIAEIRKLSVSEFRDMDKPSKAETHKKRIEAAQEEAEKIIAEPQIKIETPEDYDKAAEALKKEAKKRREAELTPEQKIEIEAKKQREREEKERKRKEKEEGEKLRIQKEAEKIAKGELLKDTKFREEIKEDLSESDIKGIEELEKDPILNSQDKRVILTLIEKGEIRGKKQISETIELYRLQRSRASKVSVGVEKKQKEIEKHLKQIAETASRLANLITALSGQFINYPETIQFLPPKEGQSAKLAMENLLLIIAEFKKVSDEARSKIKQLEVMNE